MKPKRNKRRSSGATGFPGVLAGSVEARLDGEPGASAPIVAVASDPGAAEFTASLETQMKIGLDELGFSAGSGCAAAAARIGSLLACGIIRGEAVPAAVAQADKLLAAARWQLSGGLSRWRSKQGAGRPA